MLDFVIRLVVAKFPQFPMKNVDYINDSDFAEPVPHNCMKTFQIIGSRSTNHWRTVAYEKNAQNVVTLLA